MLADEMYRISSASLPQPSPRSQLRSTVVITSFPGFPTLLNLPIFLAKGYHRSAEQPDADSESTQIAIEVRRDAFGFVDRDEMKANAIIRSELGEQREIR